MRNLAQIRTHVILVPANTRDNILAAYEGQTSVECATAAVGLKIASMPDDPAYAQKWALPKIAWNQAYGNISIIGSAKLAVLDTGVDAAHPDLASRMIAGQSFVNGSENTSVHQRERIKEGLLEHSI